MSHFLALDGGWAATREAEHAARQLASAAGLPVTVACTHFAADPARVVVTLETPDAPSGGPGSWAVGDAVDVVCAAHRERVGGRAFTFPGSDELTGVTTVGAVLSAGVITRVVALGGSQPDASTPLDTQDFVRPHYIGGELVLRVRPAAGGTLVPFEQPTPTPCCADH